MSNVEIFVSLKLPDPTAITAFHTLEKMGYKELKSLKRKDYYCFEIEQDEEDFKKKISKVDVIVNANKHNVEFELKKERKDVFEINVLIENKADDGLGLLSVLRERLGFNDIKKISKGTLWTLGIYAENERDAGEVAKNITNDLLMNEHYQNFSVRIPRE